MLHSFFLLFYLKFQVAQLISLVMFQIRLSLLGLVFIPLLFIAILSKFLYENFFGPILWQKDLQRIFRLFLALLTLFLLVVRIFKTTQLAHFDFFMILRKL